MLVWIILAACSMRTLVAEETPGLTMKGAAERAVLVSPDLRGQEAQIALREGGWRLGIRAFFPKLSISASEDDRLSLVGSDSFSKTYTLSVEQLLWDGGRLGLSRRIEGAELNLSRNQIRRNTAQVGESAVEAYKSILYKRTLLTIRHATANALTIQRSILAEEVRRGLALETDLVEADITLLQAELEVRKLKIDLEEAERQLADLLGLQQLPVLSDTIDVRRPPIITRENQESVQQEARALAVQVNPDLVTQNAGIQKRQAELQTALRSWWPTLTLTGDVNLSGKAYPLTHCSWSLALIVQFSSPYLSGSLRSRAGWDPPFDRSASVQASGNLLPDPGSALTVPAARTALALEQERFRLLFDQIGRQAERAVTACVMAEDRRSLVRDQLRVAEQKKELVQIRRNLGQATALDVMKAQMEYAEQEIALVDAYAGLLQAERGLEQLLDLDPGGLRAWVLNSKRQQRKSDDNW